MGSGGGQMGRVRGKKWVRGACLAMLGGGVLGQGEVMGGEIWTGGTVLNDNKWTTAENWSPVGAPANDGSAHVVMMGPDGAASLVDVPWSIEALEYPLGAVGFAISGSELTVGFGGID